MLKQYSALFLRINAPRLAIVLGLAVAGYIILFIDDKAPPVLSIISRQSSSLFDFLPNVHQENKYKQCRSVYSINNKNAIEHATKYMVTTKKVAISEDHLINLTKNCHNFRQIRRYITKAMTEKERDFPIAYSLLVYKDIEQVERLLRMIYRPQNYYCIHVDLKSPMKFTDALSGIVNCFDNVFFSSTSYDVRWGTMTVLEPEIRCMKDLLRYKTWKYFINLTGQEMPLKTNLELVDILKIYNGANDIDGSIKRRDVSRTHGKEKQVPIPGNLTIVKGSVHITASRGFVEFMIHNAVAVEFLHWLNGSHAPDEAFFATLHHNPQLGAPGAYTGKEHETHSQKLPFITRYKNWGFYPFNYTCATGKRVREICILSIGDLPMLSRRPELFANKFHQDYSPLGYDCLEELHFNRTKADYLGERVQNLTFYRNLTIVKNHLSALLK